MLLFTCVNTGQSLPSSGQSLVMSCYICVERNMRKFSQLMRRNWRKILIDLILLVSLINETGNNYNKRDIESGDVIFDGLNSGRVQLLHLVDYEQIQVYDQLLCL